MAQCQATKRNGETCGAHAVEGSPFCFFHSPAHARDRAEAHRRGGRGKAAPHAGDAGEVPAKIRDVEGVLALLDYTLIESLALNNGIARNRLLTALAAAYVDALQVGELEERLAALEQLLDQQRVGL